MGEKLYLDAQTLLEDSFRLGAQIINSGFKPSFIVALWRGGVPMGIAVQEFLKFHGIETDHIAIPMGTPPRHSATIKLGLKPLLMICAPRRKESSSRVCVSR